MNSHPLARTRRAHGLSQNGLAALASVSKPTVARIEAGARLLHCPETLRQIAKALGVSVHDITEPDQISEEAGFVATACWLGIDSNDPEARDYLNTLRKQVAP